MITRPSHRRATAIVVVCLLASCSHAPTPVAAVADVATKIQQSANVILHAAETGNSTVIASTGRPLVSRQSLDDVALSVNKIGRLGLSLKSTLDDYNAAKAAGRDVNAQKAVVQQIIADLNDALAVVGKAVPSGTIQTIDQAVLSILSLIAQVKASAAL